jgi:hypothetical protein
MVVLYPLGAQTNLDLANQTKDVNFAGAASTRVWKTGASLPASCTIGEGFFLTGAGPNLYVCSASNVWSPVAPATAGTGSQVQSISGTFLPNSVPVVDGTGTQVTSGCTASTGAMTCSGGFNGGAGATRITVSEGAAAAAPAPGQQTIYLDSANHSLSSIDSQSLVRRYATIDGTETLTAKTLANPSLGSTTLTSSFPNETSTGTTLNMLAKLTGTPSAAQLLTIADASGIAGIVVSGAGNSGSASVAISGQASCIFDGATVSGDYVTASSTTAGNCHDAGSSWPGAGQAIGRVMSSNGAAGNYGVLLFGPGGGGNGSGGGGGSAGGTLTAGYFGPFGVDFGSAASTGGFAANTIACWEAPWLVGQTPHNIVFEQYGGIPNTHIAWAIYDLNGNLLFQSSTYAGNANSYGVASVSWTSPVTLNAGTQYALCYTDDSTSAQIIGQPINFFSLMMTNYLGTGTITPKFAYTASSRSTGTASLTFPSTLGITTTMTSPGAPFVLVTE